MQFSCLQHLKLFCCLSVENCVVCTDGGEVIWSNELFIMTTHILFFVLSTAILLSILHAFCVCLNCLCIMKSCTEQGCEEAFRLNEIITCNQCMSSVCVSKWSRRRRRRRNCQEFESIFNFTFFLVRVHV